MTSPLTVKPISDLRRRMLEDMAVRRMSEKTQNDYIKHVETFTRFLGRAPDTATSEDLLPDFPSAYATLHNLLISIGSWLEDQRRGRWASRASTAALHRQESRSSSASNCR